MSRRAAALSLAITACTPAAVMPLAPARPAAAPTAAAAPVVVEQTVAPVVLERFDPGLPPSDYPPLSDDELRASGLDAEVLAKLVATAERTRSDSLVVVHGERTVLERYFGRPRGVIETMSDTKSFVSIAFGFLLAEQTIASLDAPLSTWFPEFKKGNKAKLTLRHVLSHTSGIEHLPRAGVLTKQKNRLEYVRGLPVVDEPGKKFSYNNEAVQLLSGVVEAASKEPIDRYLAKRLFEPLGITEFGWQRDGAGNPATAWGLALHARDMEKIGVVLANKGAYKGRQVIPAEWIAISTAPISPDTFYSGLLWWIESEGPFVVPTAQALEPFAELGFTGKSKLEPLLGRRFTTRAAFFLEAGALLEPAEREKLASLVRDDRLPFVVEPARPVGFRADGWLGQHLVVLPGARLVAVRQRREPRAADYERENELYGFKDFPAMVRALVKK